MYQLTSYTFIVIAQSDYQYRPFSTVWIRIGLSDPTAFQLSLAGALLFKESTKGKPVLDFTDNEKSAKYYFNALAQLSGRLSDRLDCVKAGVVATVLGCICHDVCFATFCANLGTRR
jgi:hypothetical protein